MQTLTVILIPLLGTVLGSAMALFMKKQISCCVEKLLLGFASGVMIAASVWSLLLPSLEEGEGWLTTAAGFMTGAAFLLLLDTLIPHLHIYSREREGVRRNISSRTMLIIAVTIHNFPEGMAVGAVLADIAANNHSGEYMEAVVLAVGIAIQNFPEGAIIAMPLRSGGMSRLKSFGIGALSGVAEPSGAVITMIVASQMVELLPFSLAFAAGAMIYVVVDELIPESRSDDCFNVSTMGAVLGFVLMMVLDVSLG